MPFKIEKKPHRGVLSINCAGSTEPKPRQKTRLPPRFCQRRRRAGTGAPPSKVDRPAFREFSEAKQPLFAAGKKINKVHTLLPDKNLYSPPSLSWFSNLRSSQASPGSQARRLQLEVPCQGLGRGNFLAASASLS